MYEKHALDHTVTNEATNPETGEIECGVRFVYKMASRATKLDRHTGNVPPGHPKAKEWVQAPVRARDIKMKLNNNYHRHY